MLVVGVLPYSDAGIYLRLFFVTWLYQIVGVQIHSSPIYSSFVLFFVIQSNYFRASRYGPPTTRNTMGDDVVLKIRCICELAQRHFDVRSTFKLPSTE